MVIMKAIIFTILTTFMFFSTMNAQVSIECPADVTVNAFDLDSDYESYGDPVVNSVGSYSLERDFTVIDNNCNGQMVTINYTASEDGTSNSAFCIQTIAVTVPGLSDIEWPESSYTLATGNAEDLDPDNMTERPEPYDLLIGGGASTIVITYEDLVISDGSEIPFKAVRTWTALNWCSSETSTFIQVLKIDQLEGSVFGVLDIPTASGSVTTVNAVNVTTDQAGFTLDLDNCTLDNNLLEYLNCVAENNAIDPTSNFIVELDGEDDDLNGVSTLDMVITQRHILGIQPLNNECYLLAADVTNDGKVTAVDLLTMRKLILGVIPTLPFSPSWIFINEAQSSSQFTLIDELDFTFPKGLFPLESLKIKAIKIGDVNGSAAN